MHDPPLLPTLKGTTNIEGLICRSKDTKNDTCKGDCSIASTGNLRSLCMFCKSCMGSSEVSIFLLLSYIQRKYLSVKLRVEPVPEFLVLNKIHTRHHGKHYESME